MMTTRCPHCGAAFRVAPDQLRVRDGLVRCGQCQTVFDGYAGLSSPEGGEAASPQVLRGRTDMMSRPEQALREPNLIDDEDDDGLGPEAAPPSSFSVWPDPERREQDVPFVWRTRGLAADAADAALLADEAAEHGQWHVRGEARTRQIDSLDSGRTPPPFMDDERQERSRVGHLAWVVGSMVGLLLLGAQGLMVYRTQIALAAPSLRPALELLCQPLNCHVGYARRAERISIMSSSLHRSSENATPDGLVLNVVMRNRYEQPQEWPSLMLSLTDMSDTVVARRVLLPAEYLPPWPGRGPFGAGQEVTLAVPIDTGKLSVNGYRIDKFFP